MEFDNVAFENDRESYNFSRVNALKKN